MYMNSTWAPTSNTVCVLVNESFSSLTLPDTSSQIHLASRLKTVFTQCICELRLHVCGIWLLLFFYSPSLSVRNPEKPSELHVCGGDKQAAENIKQTSGVRGGKTRDFSLSHTQRIQTHPRRFLTQRHNVPLFKCPLTANSTGSLSARHFISHNAFLLRHPVLYYEAEWCFYIFVLSTWEYL